MSEKKKDPFSRRRFLRKTAAGAIAAGFAIPLKAAGAAREFKIGLIGCGGRGTSALRNVVNAAKENGDKATIYALADLFRDKVARPARQYDVPPERTFTGFDAFQKLLETDIDYVILATPPHFRPEHFEAAINAGKHVFTEKPVAVDPVGIRRFLAAGRNAKKKGLSVAAGTQRRHQKQYIEAQKRVADGAIGQIVAGRCYWNMGGLWTRKQDPNWTDTEWQIRNWLYFTWLSGDHVVEQHVHNLDVINWFLGKHPVGARGMGGRQVRTGKKEYGHIYDHFATELIYESPSPSTWPDIRVISMCRQIAGCWREVSEFVVGTKGSSNCSSRIFGPNSWNWSGKQIDPYVQEHIDLQQSIKEGNGRLNEARNVAHSTMTAILCRTACYTGQEISWDQLIESDDRLGPNEYKFGPMAIPKVAMPGKPM